MPYNIGYRTVYYIGEPEHEKLTSLTTTTGGPVKYADVIAKYNASNKFTDPDFPPNNDSIDVENFSVDLAKDGTNLSGWDQTVRWERPREALKLYFRSTLKASGIPDAHIDSTDASIIKQYNDQLVPQGLCLPGSIGQVAYQINNPGDSFKKSRFDVQQGQVGDCWFISGVAQITVAQELIDIVVPDDNEQNNDSGAYHYRMWIYGVCTDVVIDDYLPLYEPNGPGTGYKFILGAPKLVKGTLDFEFWGCLAEKAYAKLNGNISRLSGNQPRYGLEDLTGGISDFLPLTEQAMASTGDVFKTLQNLSGITFVNFYTDGSDNNGVLTGKNAAQGKAYGLARPHAYSMTRVATVKYNGQDVRLVCLRNPWGSGEWKGPWNENSDEWNSVSEEEKKALGLVKSDDGEFWLTWDDVQRYFYQIDICYWFPEPLFAPLQKIFTLQQHHSRWSDADGTNGGWNNPSANPQYVVEVKADEGAIIASLEAKSQLKDQTLCVGINCYRVANPSNYDLTKPLGPEFFYDTENKEYSTEEEEKGIVESEKTNVVLGTLRVGKGWKVPAGTYVIVPKLYTSGAKREVGFLLRLAGQISAEKQQVQGQTTAVVPPPPAPAPLPVPAPKPADNGTAPAPPPAFNWDDAIQDNTISLDQSQLDYLNRYLGGDSADELNNLLGNYDGKHLTSGGVTIRLSFL